MRNKMTMMVAVVALMVAMLAPAALAQSVDIDGDENTVTNEGDNTEYNAVAQNLIGSIGDVDQSQYGVAVADSDASAYADDHSEATADSAATAEVDQSQHFTVVQYNSALNDF
jgi:hypothetical protein